MNRPFSVIAALLLGWLPGFALQVEPQAPQEEVSGVALPAEINGIAVYLGTGRDEAAAQEEVRKVEKLLAELRAQAALSSRLGLREREGIGILLLDGKEILEFRRENSPDPTLSPLANALSLRERLIASAAGLASWDEEELLLRLLLGIVFPFSLLVILRLVRTGILRWEKDWRRPAREWLVRAAERRGYADSEITARRIINLLVGIERLAVYFGIITLFSFCWFTLFPQTRALALTLSERVIGPVLDIVGWTLRTILYLLYTVTILGLALLLTRRMSSRRPRAGVPALLSDPILGFPVRLSLWLVALFMVLFPYPGVPRLLAVGILLLALLAALIALRPLIEEIAAGMYLGGRHGLRRGDTVAVDGVTYQIDSPCLVHLRVKRDGEDHWLPYSRILRSELRVKSHSPT